jgi:hypothetical protein
MVERHQIENIIKNYFVIPWQPPVNVEKILKESSISLNNFIIKQIIPEVFTFLKNQEIKEKEKEKEKYISQLSDCLIEAKYLKLEKRDPPKKKKKMTYKEIMAEMTSSKKTNEGYRQDQKEKLTKELILCNGKKLDII